VDALVAGRSTGVAVRFSLTCRTPIVLAHHPQLSQANSVRKIPAGFVLTPWRVTTTIFASPQILVVTARRRHRRHEIARHVLAENPKKPRSDCIFEFKAVWAQLQEALRPIGRSHTREILEGGIWFLNKRCGNGHRARHP